MSSKYASLARTETSACHFSAKKIRDFSTALGMTKKALTEMNLHCDTGFAVLSDAFPGRATPRARVQYVPRQNDPEIGTEISRNRRNIRTTEHDHAVSTQ